MGQDRYMPRSFTASETWQQADEKKYQELQDAASRRGRPMRIDKALREYCHIPCTQYFLATTDNSGKTHVFSSFENKEIANEFFNQSKFERCVQSNSISTTTSQYDETTFTLGSEFNQYSADAGRPWPHGRYSRRLESFDDDFGGFKARKRSRVSTICRDHDFDDPPAAPPTPTRRPLLIGDSDAVLEFFIERFKNCQQTACKLIAKAWIKAIEPKKQSNHPYTGKDEKAPEWWPLNRGEGQQKVRHKEPDHLYKGERVALLCHILRMIVEPNRNQHPDIQKMNLDVAKLQEITTEALSSWYADKQNPANAQKKPFLDEIFKVAKYEERFKSGGIDYTTKVYVRSSKDDKDAQDADSDEEDNDIPTPVSEGGPLPKGTHALIPDQTGSSHVASGSYTDGISVRSQYTQPILGSALQQEQAHYVDDGGMPSQACLTHGGIQGMYVGHDSSRRNSIFTHSEYTSPTTPVYANWQSGTTAPGNQPMYAITPHTGHPPYIEHLEHQSVSDPQSQQHLGTSFDGISRGTEMNHGYMFRPGGFVSNGNGGYHYQLGHVSDPNVKLEPLPLPPPRHPGNN